MNVFLGITTIEVDTTLCCHVYHALYTERGYFMKLSHRHPSNHRFLIQVFISLLVTVSLLLIGQGTYSRAAYAAPANYSCGDNSSNHCYAFYQWHGGVNGASTNINVPFLGGSPSSDGFTNWEMWVQATNCGSGLCWVEAGITTQYCCTLGSYFWADKRPDGSYNNHYPQQVGPNDLVETFQIYKQDNYTWNVYGYVWSCGGGQNGQCSPSWSGQSTSNNMSPDNIQIGKELAGTYGQQGLGSDWQFNYYRCGSSWCKQFGLGNPGSGYSGSGGIKTGPLSGYWNHQPNNSGDTGDWFAY